jgi:hypothetical protein
MFEEFVFLLPRHVRPSKYKGIGWRGGVLLAIYWLGVGGLAGASGWSIEGLVASMLGELLVGWQLERLGGAIAVAVFSAGIWSLIGTATFAQSTLGTVVGAILGFVGGFSIAFRTRE